MMYFGPRTPAAVGRIAALVHGSDVASGPR